MRIVAAHTGGGSGEARAAIWAVVRSQSEAGQSGPMAGTAGVKVRPIRMMRNIWCGWPGSGEAPGGSAQYGRGWARPGAARDARGHCAVVRNSTGPGRGFWYSRLYPIWTVGQWE